VKRQVYSAGVSVTRRLRRQKPNAQQRGAIEALENAAADLEDLQVLRPLAEAAGLPWIELYPDVETDWPPKRTPKGGPRKAAAAPNETPVQRRRRLRANARERQRTTVPRLKAAIREIRKARKARHKQCVTGCKARRAKIQREAQKAREALRKRIAELKVKARATCARCKTSAKEAELDALDKALAELAAERLRIAELRRLARQSVSSRGQAGGRRAAELRAEQLDQVARDVADDPILASVWAAHGAKLRPKARASLTETFLEWLADHPNIIEEHQRKLERDYEADAEALLGRLAKARDEEPADWHRELDAADRWLLRVAPQAMGAPF